MPSGKRHDLADNGMLPEAVWTHLLVQNCPLDYLYELWMNDPNTLTPELAEIIKPVLERDYEAHKVREGGCTA